MKKFINSMLFSMLYKSLFILPTPINISIWWNFGSILGVCLMTQILSGLFLSMHYCPNIDMAFASVNHIDIDVSWGWIFRYLHINGASLYFICMYSHIGRGIYYHSFFKIQVWVVGVIILFLSMGVAFMGYVLPWGQMSFWGATVITNLLSAIPYLGGDLVKWIWGGFSINNATLNRFYSFHFIMPLMIVVFVIVHLFYLHLYGSSNPMGLNSNKYMITFHPYYMIKDLLGFGLVYFLLLVTCFQYPNILLDPDNFSPANPLVTPIHIQPEWYFLFAYSILRSIPSKLGGVLALFMSIIMLLFLPILTDSRLLGMNSNPIMQYMFWMFVSSFILLTWTGARPIEFPYLMISQIVSLIYFVYFFTGTFAYDMFEFYLYNKNN